MQIIRTCCLAGNEWIVLSSEKRADVIGGDVNRLTGVTLVTALILSLIHI